MGVAIFKLHFYLSVAGFGSECLSKTIEYRITEILIMMINMGIHYILYFCVYI